MSYSELTELPTAAITHEKLIAKLCFVRFGDGLDRRGDQLLTDMYRHLRALDGKPVTRQTIKNWIKYAAVPRRNGALIFLNSYMASLTGLLSALPQERRKVFSQITRFLKQNVLHDLNDRIMPWRPPGALSNQEKIHVYSTEEGRILLDFVPSQDEVANTSSPLPGIYFAYRMRFRFTNSQFVARELIHIYREGKGMRFRYWYLHEGTELAKFEGIVSVIGYSIWLIGGNSREVDRLGVLKFRYVASQSVNRNKILWGIMLTDLPRISAPEPVSCRIFLVRLPQGKSEGNSESLARREVKNLTPDEVDAKWRDVIVRAIDNHVTANSMPNSIEPVLNRQGFPASDPILKVDQQMVDNVDYSYRMNTAVGGDDNMNIRKLPADKVEAVAGKSLGGIPDTSYKITS